MTLFDLWVKIGLEMWFMPYRILGKQDELATICKGFMGISNGVRG